MVNNRLAPLRRRLNRVRRETTIETLPFTFHLSFLDFSYHLMFWVLPCPCFLKSLNNWCVHPLTIPGLLLSLGYE